MSLGDRRQREFLGIGEASLNPSLKVKIVNLVHKLDSNLLCVAKLCDQRVQQG